MSILFICLLSVAMKTRRNSRITPRGTVGMYCRPFGFKEENYVSERSDSDPIVSEEHDEGNNSTIDIFCLGRCIIFFQVHP